MNKKIRTNYLILVLVLVLAIILIPQNTIAEATVKTASTPAEFSAAWNEPTTTKIILKEDIIYGTGTTGLNNRGTDIEITGEEGPGDYGYRLNLKRRSLRVDSPKTDSGKATLKLHDIIVENTGTVTATGSGFVEDNAYAGNTASNWTFEMGNIQVPKGDTYRLGRVTRGQVNLFGKLNISTRGENFYTGGMYFAKGTEYYGEITYENFSTIWFRSSIREGDSGNGKFELDSGSSVKLRNTGTGITYPAVYRAYKEIIVGEDAEFTATVPGSAVQFGGTNKKFIAKKGSVVTLTSLNSYSSIVARSTTGGSEGVTGEDVPADPIGAQMIFEPGSSLFVIGKSGTSGMIDWTRGTNNKIVIDTPEQFDIRNNNSNRALNTSGSNSIEILNSNLDMWKNGSSVTGDSDFSHSLVDSFNVNGSNVSTSSSPLLQSEYNGVSGQIRRIMGLNTKPDFLWEKQITDADKTLSKIARVRLGMVPDDNGLDENGDLSFIPMYARKDQASVKITDNKNAYPEKEFKTEEQGYISYTVPTFYTAETILTGQAARSGLEGDVSLSKEIVDITPPSPAKLTISEIKTSTKELIGKNSEPNASVYVHVNGQRQAGVIKVDENGNWNYQIPNYFKVNDLITIYLEDNALKAPEDLNPSAPATNNILGNINPEKELAYRDAIFLRATSFTVKDDVAAKPLITKAVTSNTLDSGQNQITQVGSILSYKIIIKNDDLKESQKVLTKSLFEDTLPAGLNFNLSELTATKNGEEILTSDFVFQNGKISYEIGELKPQDQIVIEFPTTVTREAVDTVITNTAKINGTTTQETVLVNEASINNPGGTVAGQLILESAPTDVDFGIVKITDFQKKVGVDKSNIGTPLVVEDTRKSRSEWYITAQIEKEMTNADDVQVGALKYVSNQKEITLNANAQTIYTNDGSSNDFKFNISDEWEKGDLADGLKLQIGTDKVPKTTGSYEGIIRWTLRDTIE